MLQSSKQRHVHHVASRFGTDVMLLHYYVAVIRCIKTTLWKYTSLNMALVCYAAASRQQSMRVLQYQFHIACMELVQELVSRLVICRRDLSTA